MIGQCIGLLIGLSCLFWLQNEQQSFYLLVLSLAALISFALFSSVRKVLKPLLSITFGLFWGAISVSVWLISVPQLLSKPEVVEISGYICSLPTSNEASSRFGKIKPHLKDSRFDFCLTKINHQSILFYHPNKLKLSYYRAPSSLINNLKAGTFWSFKAKLKPIHGRLNPGGFDYEKWLVSEGYIGTGYVKQSQLIETTFSIKAKYHQLRQSLYNKLNEVVIDNEFKGMVMALAIGERSEINAEQWQAVKGSGTSHLLAISGLHIGIAALWSYYFCLFFVTRMRWITARIPAQKVAQVAALMGAIAITLISGLGYPAQRALLMLVVFMLVKWSGRQISLANVLALSVMIILLLQPFAIITISFWLSVFAVTIIVFLLSYQQQKTDKNHKIKAWLRMNWYLFIALMPMTWLIFDSISVVSLLANLLLIPLTTFLITPLVYLGLLALLINYEVSSWLFYITDKLIWFGYKIQLTLSNLNSTVSFSSLSESLFILILLAIFIIMLPAKFPIKKLLYPIVITVLLFSFQEKDNAPFKMVVFDIGQGLAVHISVGNKHLLYDTGYGNKNFSMAQNTLIPYFKRQNINQLEQLIVSHGDSDHAGGFNALKNEIKIKMLMVGEKLKYNSGSSGENCHIMAGWQWNEVKFSFIPHLNPVEQKSNNRSCVLSVEVAGKKILLTGDIEKKAERKLLQNGIAQHDVIIVAHHGSLTSSTINFVNVIKPKIAIHSTGYANQWQFPKHQVLERFTNVGAKNYITHELGAISITLDDDNEFVVSSERQSRPHFWQLNTLAN